MLGYNFLIGDFLLVLRRGDAHPSDDEAVLVRGFASPLYNRDGDLSFGEFLFLNGITRMVRTCEVMTRSSFGSRILSY